MIDWYDITLLIFAFTGWGVAYKFIPQERYLFKSSSFFIFIFVLEAFANYVFKVNFNEYLLIFDLLIAFILYKHWKIRNIKSDRLNNDNVFLIFYKAKKPLQSWKGALCSSGLYINGYVYQLRYEHETLQKIKLRNEEYLEKYLVIDTKFKWKDLKGNWEEELLRQKRITFYRLWRLNCLRSLMVVLNQIRGFEYFGVLPMVYLSTKVARFKNGR